MHSDEILFVEKGKVIERGTHSALIERRGRYYDLFKLQTQAGSDQNATEEGLDKN